MATPEGNQGIIFMNTKKKEVIGPKSRKQEMFITSKADIVFFGGAAGCVDAETEFLSQHGWKKISEYTPDDLVMQFDLNTKVASLVNPSVYIKAPCDGFYHIKNNKLDQMLSIEHNIVYENRKGKMFKVPFAEFMAKHNSSANGHKGLFRKVYEYSGGKSIGLSKFEIMLAVALKCDGHIASEKTSRYIVRLKKQRKIDRLRWILAELNYPYTETDSVDSYKVFTLYAPWCTKQFSDWMLCSKEDAKVITDEIMFWDGSLNKDRPCDMGRFSTTIKEDADCIQYLYNIQNIHASIGINDRRGQGYKDNEYVRKSVEYSVTPSTNIVSTLENIRDKVVFEYVKSNDGYKYCFTVPTGAFVMRRNNKVVVTGNSGKSFLGVMDFLQHIHHKNFRGVFTRRTTTQLKGPGGLLDKAMDLFKRVDPKVRFKSMENKFVFSSGAEVYLRHFEHLKDKDNWQGMEISEALIDECVQYEEEMFLYILSRLRNPSCPEVKPRIRCTMNPDSKSWVKNWISWWLDEEGYPIEERCGQIRYFVRRDNTNYYANTPEELMEQFKVRREIVMSFTFINATCLDNPVLMEAQPEYIGWLESLGRVEKARLLKGNWLVTEESSGYWKKEWCEVVDKPPLDAIKVARAWDISGSLPSELMPNPDWTAGVRISKDRYGTYYIEDVVRFRARHGEVFERMVEAAKQDGEDTLIVVPADPGASGKQYASTLIRDLAERGFYAKSKPTSKSKVQRFAPFCAACESGNVKIVAGEWNDAFIDELEAFDGSRRVKDD